MSSSMHTILIIGGTAGIGLSFAKRFHSMGKKVIITGRPGSSKIADIQKSIPEINAYAFDVTDVAALPSHVEEIFKRWPSIDTVWVNSGVQIASSIKDVNSSSDDKVIEEVTANLIAPTILARHIVPRLLALNEGNFLITSSGLGFVPAPPFSVYCSTKAAIHQYLISLRQALKDTHVNIIEITPPFVEGTELGRSGHQDMLAATKGMTLEEFTNDIFAKLDSTPASKLKEVAAGSAQDRVDFWRSGFAQYVAKIPSLNDDKGQ
ncbi:short-chain dehydrogenase/reductase-like protein SDR [Teratosphaeria nubilosa]|uniref:Short-chain dehydrogenase/reductase-like protein SDR n=1 Tax=Teratosphaeria nubilosa TaxID=161662 RepID=A0A6G1L420_9PEZI|nr:short-chain dehydrogenase/reductase-like protein SDR [Teratosphaeria nubilosa]